MARPTKQGVDYFPLDVHLDDKFKFIEIKYKLEGFAIIVKLIQKIYSYGYWYQWGEDEELLFTNEVRSQIDIVQGVINEAIQREIFDKQLYDKYKILTSKGIQKRYLEMVRRRKDVEVIKEYKVIADIFGVNEVINGVNDNIMYTSCQHDDSKSTQSKVNQSKVNQSKVDKSKEDKSKEDTVEETIDYAGIITYLNSRAGTKFKSSTRKTQDLIKARFNENFIYEDFKTVIDKKCNEWLESDMQKFLRPETLFGTKFEGYLNQQVTKKRTTQDLDMSDVDFEIFD